MVVGFRKGVHECEERKEIRLGTELCVDAVQKFGKDNFSLIMKALEKSTIRRLRAIRMVEGEGFECDNFGNPEDTLHIPKSFWSCLEREINKEKSVSPGKKENKKRKFEGQ